MPYSVIGSIAGVMPLMCTLTTLKVQPAHSNDTIELIDPDNGYPLEIMDWTSITNMRTGAAAGLATKYLARENSEGVGFVGSGVRHFYHSLH